MEALGSDNKAVLVKLFNRNLLDNFLSRVGNEEKKIFHSIVSLGQAERIFAEIKEEDFSAFKVLLNSLLEIDRYYEDIGGIEGYYKKFISLMRGEEKKADGCAFLEPNCVDLSMKSHEIQDYIKEGLKSLPLLAEIYPLGGAGDRLDLLDHRTKEPLPQAKFVFLGKTLIEHLILDLKAREYLYQKNYNKKLITPIVIMTSDVKNNHQHILDIFEENNFFGRPKESVFFIKQISVPLINEEGNFVLKGHLELELKPGGHGVLWRLMSYYKAFDWLKDNGRTKAVVRQINNPVAAVDYNLLAFAGYGIKEDKTFGFASCPRRVGSPEGMNVIKERKIDSGYEYNISNIEYTDFKIFGVPDMPSSEGSIYSKFPSNTNTLFVDLKAIETASKKDPLPGIIINLKNSYVEEGKELKAGRLELLMQSIADNFVDSFQNKISQEKCSILKSFITNNVRRKTISVIKNPYVGGLNIFDTPLGAHFDVHQNCREILSNFCEMDLPKEDSLEEFVKHGPSFLCYLNPMLGPVFSDIGQKIFLGHIKKGSEIRLDLAECEIKNLYLDGSLLISGYTKDYFKTSKCILKNVKVKNEGIDRNSSCVFFENQIHRTESLKIVLHENSIFEAEDVVFEKDLFIEVPKDHKIRAFDKEGIIYFQKSSLYS